MKTAMGVWIDHKQAILVTNLSEPELVRLLSNMEKRIRYSGASESRDLLAPHDATTEDGRDRRFEERLKHYYDEVISYLRDADEVFIMGPGEARLELQKHMLEQGLHNVSITVQPADKMTDEQVVAAVRRHFLPANNPVAR
jgi:hypothetical protein